MNKEIDTTYAPAYAPAASLGKLSPVSPVDDCLGTQGQLLQNVIETVKNLEQRLNSVLHSVPSSDQVSETTATEVTIPLAAQLGRHNEKLKDINYQINTLIERLGI